MAEPLSHSGGCQCGAVRFLATGAPLRVSVCHCRMCQRASGNLFAPLAEWNADKVEWTGSPARFASSDQGERGFCAACGTPLYLRFPDGDTIEIMIGALAEPGRFAPAYQYGIESRVGWSTRLHAIAGYETLRGPDDAGLTAPVSRQAEEGA